MAVPTIATVTPNTGRPIGGFLVTVTGTGFRLPPELPWDHAEQSGFQQTVKVTVNGVQVEQVNVLSETRLNFLCPRYTGDPADKKKVDLYLANLDDDGDVIETGIGSTKEEVTKEDAIEFVRPRLTDKTMLQEAVRQVIREVKRALVPNVYLFSKKDFAEDGATFIAEMDMPCIVLIGPALFWNGSEVSEQEVIEQAGQFDILVDDGSFDIEYEVIGLADPGTHVLNLADEFQKFVKGTPQITLRKNPNQADSDECSFEFGIPIGDEPKVNPQASEDDIWEFTCKVRMYGVDLRWLAGAEDVVVAQEFEVTEIDLQSRALEEGS